MTSQLHLCNNKNRKKTLPLSNTPTHAMFESHPFVVQSKSDDHVQQPNLKACLIQAEKYGHHLSKTNLGNQLVPTAIQAKPNVESPVQLAVAKKPKKRNIRKKPLSVTKLSNIFTKLKIGGKKRQNQPPTEDQAAKNKLGHVPGTFSLPEKPKDYVGTYAGQRENFKKTPSGNKVEADHMTPDSLHQPLGQKRKTSDGTGLSKRLPAAQLPYELHRRKNTTGSGKEVEHQRAYLLHAHHGQVPFAGPMGTPEDHYAAAMEIDLRNTFDDRTVFGKPNSLDPRTFPPTHKQGMAIPFEDMAWSADRTKEMIHESNRQERISSEGKTHLDSVVEEQLEALKGRYPKPK